MSHASWRITGLDCPDCANAVDKSVARLDGVVSAHLNFASGVLAVEYDADLDPRADVSDTLRRMGYGAEQLGRPVRLAAAGETEESAPSWWQRHRADVASIASGVFIVAAWIATRTSAPELVSVALYACAIFTGGLLVFRRAVASARARSRFATSWIWRRRPL